MLSLYDDERLRGPLWHGQPASWQEIDQHVMDALREAGSSKREIVLLSGTIASPSTRRIIAEWRTRYPNFRHVEYDPVSMSALRAANAQSFGRAVVPHYAFNKARVIVGLEADFLGTWLSPVEFARQYAANRKPEGTPALHIQFESGMSVTGSNADVRVAVPPSQIGTGSGSAASPHCTQGRRAARGRNAGPHRLQKTGRRGRRALETSR